MKIAIIALLLFLPINIFAGNKQQFYNASDIYGTSIIEPNSICKDRRGFIWIASKSGVYRLSDNNCKLYVLPYSSMNVVSVEITHRENRLVAFTNQGEVFSYDPVADRFSYCMNFPEMINRDSAYLSQIEIDDKGDMWIASSSGLYVYSDSTLVPLDDVRATLGDLVHYDAKSLIAGSPEGIYKIDTSTHKVDKLCTPEGVFPTRLCVDIPNNKIWVGTMANGLHYVDLGSKTMKRAGASNFPRQYVRDIELISDSTIWCGIDGRGVWELSRDGNRVITNYQENSDNPASIGGNGVQDMLYDNEERIWVCSYTGGVSVADINPTTAVRYTHQINNNNSLINNYVYDIAEDAYGQLWIGTNSGLSCWDKSSNKWTNFFGNDKSESFIVQAVCLDNNGNIWAGTYSHGAYVIDTKNKTIKAHHTMPGGILSNTGFVFDILKDHNGDIWLAGMIGDIMKFDAKNGTFESYPSIPVTTMAELNDSTLLLGSTSRLLALNTKTREYSAIISNYVIRDIDIFDGNIWIGSSGNGLICHNIESGKTEKYDTRQGFPANHVNSVTIHDGDLWLGTDIGLCRFDVKNRIVTECRLPASSAGYNFTSDASICLNDGNTAWGTSKGLLVVSPESTPSSDYPGHIYLDDILLSGKSIHEIEKLAPSMPLDNIEKLTLDYTHNNITFNLLPLGTNNTSALFSHKLDGVDDNWTNPSSANTISYGNLLPGDYTLHIRMHNPDVVKERHIQLSITPPFWATWWFKLLATCMIILMLLFVIRYYVHRLNRKNAESKLQFFVTTAHDLRTALTLIKAPIEELKYSKDLTVSDRECIRMASEHVKRLSAVTTKLLDFQKIDIGKTQLNFNPQDIVAFIRTRISMFSSLADQKSIIIEFHHDKDSYVTSVDINKMEQIVDNLISNAIKYSPVLSTIEVAFSGNDKNWSLSVTDHGIGICKKDQRKLFSEFYRGSNAINSHIVGSGIGLALVKKLVDIHGGRIRFESQENVGSKFEVCIPYNRPESSAEEVTAETPEHVPSTYDHSNEDMRVLICEDNDDLRQFMANALGRQFSVTAVADGEDAWNHIKESLPDLIVSDIMMPNMDGFELCRLVKSTFETSHIPLILLSALTEQADELQGLGLGADDYMTKPFDVKTLSQRIASTIRNRRNIGSRIMAQGMSTQQPRQKEEEPVNPLNDEFVRKAIDVITRHLDNTEFGKEEFAQEMGVSTSLLFKKIKALTGLSIVDFIKKVRMEHAMRLVNDQSLSISDIAYQCGFSTIGYFSTVFKKHFGKTPSECRKQ